MPRRTNHGTESRPETRPVSFRMPVEAFDDLQAVATARGVDVSAILNWIVSDHRPTLRMRANLGGSLLSGPGHGEALRVVSSLLKQLQDLHADLSRRAREDGERSAA